MLPFGGFSLAKQKTAKKKKKEQEEKKKKRDGNDENNTEFDFDFDLDDDALLLQLENVQQVSVSTGSLNNDAELKSSDTIESTRENDLDALEGNQATEREGNEMDQEQDESTEPPTPTTTPPRQRRSTRPRKTRTRIVEYNTDTEQTEEPTPQKRKRRSTAAARSRKNEEKPASALEPAETEKVRAEEEEEPPPKKKRESRAKSKQTASSADQPATDDAEPTTNSKSPPSLPPLPPDFPPQLAALDKLFRCLNTVHSFTTSARDSSTGAGGVRFSLLSASVANLLPAPPTLRDLALVSLIAGPDLLSFASMPESALDDSSLRRGGGNEGMPMQRDQDDEQVVVVFIEGSNTSRRSGAKKYNEKKKRAKMGNGLGSGGVGPAVGDGDEEDEERPGWAPTLEEEDEEEGKEDDQRAPRIPQPNDSPSPPSLSDEQPTAETWTSGFGGRSAPINPSRRAKLSLSADRINKLRKEIDRRDRHFRSKIEALAEKLEKERVEVDGYLDRIFAEENFKRRIGGQSLTSPPRKRQIAVEPVQDAEIPDRPDELLAVIPELQAEDWWKEQIVPGGLMTSAARVAKFDEVQFQLPDSLRTAFRDAQNVERFYSHQARGIDALLGQQRDVVVATSTASGKSVVYQVPILYGLERDPDFRALLIFPTKALAQDQLRSLRQLIFAHPVLRDEMEQNPWIVRTYDGDTPEEDRKNVRAYSKIVLTNPDMIHVGLLSGPECGRGSGGWDGFFARLGLVVLDELHVYSSVFGSHTCNVFRRMHRLLGLLGNDTVRFVACSATIAEPDSHMQTLLGLKELPVAVDDDGSPRGARHHLVWNPPFIDPLHPNKGRRSVVTETSSMLRFLVRQGVRTVVFCKYRKMLELLLRQVHQDLEYEGRASWKSKIVGYRAGYVATDRRKIERALFSGEVLGVIATTALELGVDIGSLDTVIHMSFPFNLASYIQQAGRAGRRRQDALSILMCDTIDPMSQYYANHPQELVSGVPTPLPIDPHNANVLEGHLNCAAFESPLDLETDFVWFTPESEEFDPADPEELILEPEEDPTRIPIVTYQGGGEAPVGPASPARRAAAAVASAASEAWRKKWLKRRLEKWLDCGQDGLYRPHARYLPRPPMIVPLRDAEEDTYSVVDDTTGKVMEEIQHSRAIFDLYEGSVFIHQGKTYLVHKLNVDRQIAWLRPTNVTYLTEQRDYKDVDAIRTRMRTKIPTNGSEDTWGFYGDVKITAKVFGYYKIDPATRKILEAVDMMDMPPFVKESVGFWVDVPSNTQMILRSMEISMDFAVHAAAHALMLVLPRRVNFGSGSDVRTECKYPFAARLRPARVTIYDGQSNGAGVTLRAFRALPELLRCACEIVETCSCEEVDGCVHCVKLSSCTEHNLALSKEGAKQVLRGLLGIVSE